MWLVLARMHRIVKACVTFSVYTLQCLHCLKYHCVGLYYQWEAGEAGGRLAFYNVSQVVLTEKQKFLTRRTKALQLH